MTEAVELRGETFTQRVRRMLTEQPERGEFTLSRGGLEVLVLDSERYGERNLEDSGRYAEAVRRSTGQSLEEQFAHLQSRFPKATITKMEHGQYWLAVPDVQLTSGYNRRKTTFYVIVPPGYPGNAPQRFYVPQDIKCRSGSRPDLTWPTTEQGIDLLRCHWVVQRWHPAQDTLYTYVQAMRRFFEAIKRR